MHEEYIMSTPSVCSAPDLYLVVNSRPKNLNIYKAIQVILMNSDPDALDQFMNLRGSLAFQTYDGHQTS
jgi:hypothetical protein